MEPVSQHGSVFGNSSQNTPKAEANSASCIKPHISRDRLKTQDSSGVTYQSLESRNIQTAGETRREQLTRILQAIRNIDIRRGDNFLLGLQKKALSELDSQQIHEASVSGCSKALHALIAELTSRPRSSANISVLQTLADLGVGFKELPYLNRSTVPPSILRQLLKNSEQQTAKKILLKNDAALICKADSGYIDLLESYLTPEEIQFAAQKAMEEHSKSPYSLRACNSTCRFSDKAAPYLLHSLFTSLHHTFALPSQPDDLSQSVLDTLHSEAAIAQLCLLEVHGQCHQQQILSELSQLTTAQQEKLLVCAFVLGQPQLFDLLSKVQTRSPQAILCQPFGQGKNILHLLASAIADTQPQDIIDPFHELNTYSPDYEKLLQLLPAERLANQQDDTGATPLALLYHHHVIQIAATPLFGSDRNLIKARRNGLLKLTSKEHLGRCMKSLLGGTRPINAIWFGEFLYLFSHLGSGDFKPATLRSGGKPEQLHELAHEVDEHQGHSVQRILYFLGEHPDALRDKEQALKLVVFMQQLKLPVEYQAQVLRVVPPGIQKYILEHQARLSDGRSLFVERDYKVFYRTMHFYPWHLISLGLGSDCVVMSNKDYTTPLLQAVEKYAQSHQKATLPDLPGHWERELTSCKEIKVYGRSLAFPSKEVPKGFRRFKFLKQQLASTEKWKDFIREQSHLTFFREHQAELGLESALLQPRGIYHLSDARRKLERCGILPSTLADIAFEADGSACLQVFDDEKNTPLYHHYPYDIQGVEGLSFQASFDGIRLFAGDAGRLWFQQFQAPDTLSSFHNAADGRAWVPTPFFGGHGVPGTLGEWNAQDYPNIAPAPVGMRDWADIRAFSECTSTSFGMRERFDATKPDVQGQLRVTELGKTFYGLVINWLRVRHDTDCLDYQDSEQRDQLAEELVIIAADLFGAAFGMGPDKMKAIIRQEFPHEALSRAAIECGYWCDPGHRYVQDVRNNRFPAEVYPDHPDQNLNKSHLSQTTLNLTDQGLWRSSGAKGPNLGVNTGTFPLTHLDSLFWFAMLTGWRESTCHSLSTVRT